MNMYTKNWWLENDIFLFLNGPFLGDICSFSRGNVLGYLLEVGGPREWLMAIAKSQDFSTQQEWLI